MWVLAKAWSSTSSIFIFSSFCMGFCSSGYCMPWVLAWSSICYFFVDMMVCLWTKTCCRVVMHSLRAFCIASDCHSGGTQRTGRGWIKGWDWAPNAADSGDTVFLEACFPVVIIVGFWPYIVINNSAYLLSWSAGVAGPWLLGTLAKGIPGAADGSTDGFTG